MWQIGVWLVGELWISYWVTNYYSVLLSVPWVTGNGDDVSFTHNCTNLDIMITNCKVQNEPLHYLTFNRWVILVDYKVLVKKEVSPLMVQ